MTAVYFPKGVTASDLLPKLVKNNIVIAGGLHKEIRGERKGIARRFTLTQMVVRRSVFPHRVR